MAATSQGQDLSFRDDNKDSHWLYASSNAFTCGSDLKEFITWFDCVNCLSVNGSVFCVDQLLTLELPHNVGSKYQLI